MSHRVHALLLLILSFAPFMTRAADGVLIPAPNAVDMVHDAKRGLVYISTSDGKILRYKISTATFLTPFAPSPTANLAGIDLMPDGSRIAVADRDYSDRYMWFHEIDLASGKATKVSAPRDASSDDRGTFSVAYAWNGDVYTASEYNGWVPLRKFPANTRPRIPKIVASVTAHTTLAASTDRKTIAFSETGISDGEWGLIDVPTGAVVRRQGYEDGTANFNFEISTDAVGSMFLVSTNHGAYAYDAEYRNIAIIGGFGVGNPAGAALDPARPRAYIPWDDSSDIRVFDTVTWQQMGSFDAGYAFNHQFDFPYLEGYARVSANGQYLMVRVGGGIRLIALAAGPPSGPVR